MRDNDNIILEKTYEQILKKKFLKEELDDYYVNLNGDIVKRNKDHKITLGGMVNLGGDIVPDRYNDEYSELEKKAKNGDEDVREKAQKIIDIKAEKLKYNPKKLFHGTLSGGFNVFDKNKIGKQTDAGFFAHAFWFSDDRDYSAANYAEEIYGKMPSGAEVKEVYLKLINPKLIKWVGDPTEKLRKVSDPMNETKKAIEDGYDGFLVEKNPRYGEWYEYGVFKSSQIKSADPFTYDDNGELIPLSQRFDSSNDDIRY